MDMVKYVCNECGETIEMFNGYTMTCQSTPIYPSHTFRPER